MATTSGNPLQKRFKASMLLSATGDAMGYKNGEWEFNLNGEEIVRQVELIGFENLNIKKPEFILSDDTIMSIATASALIEASDKEMPVLFLALAKHYKECMKDMNGRAPGNQCLNSARKLSPLKSDGYQIPYCERGGGCGAAMRSASIGLLYNKPEDIKKLVAVSVESGRMTHNHPTGFLGSLATALFTSYAIQERNIEEWGFALLEEAIPLAQEYCKSRPCVPDGFHGDVHENWSFFIDRWSKYLKDRFPKGKGEKAEFPPPAQFGIKERDKFYKSLSYSGWGGSSGHDCPMIGYDALLGSNKSWKELCYRAIFHGGDNDSTGTVACAWFGALYGIPSDVPSNHYENLEYKEKIVKLAEDLYKLATPNDHHTNKQ